MPAASDAAGAERVSFYVLARGARQQFACRLAEKAAGQGRRVHLRVADPEAARELDTRLWTFRTQSFLPHSVGASDSPHVRVTLHEEWLPEERDVLINLADAPPPEFESFARVIEIVGPEPEARDEGRARFRAYRERGADPATHKVAG